MSESKMKQLRLFPEVVPKEENVLEEVLLIKKQIDNLRRGLFKRHGEMEKEIRKMKLSLSHVRNHLDIEEHQGSLFLEAEHTKHCDISNEVSSEVL